MKKALKKNSVLLGAKLVNSSAALRNLFKEIHDRTDKSPNSYQNLKSLFVSNGDSSEFGRDKRIELIERFDEISENVPTSSKPANGLLFSEAYINLAVQGDIVECGCYAGAGTAQLSLLASHYGKKVHVFDSFEGLMEPVDTYNARDFHMRQSAEWTTEWTAGRYSSDLEATKEYVAQYGELDSCIFHKGWFQETLIPANLPASISMALVDVCQPEPLKECVSSLYPRLIEGGVFFSYSSPYVQALQTIMAEDYWRNELGISRPIYWGAGFGLSDISPHLGFMVKGDNTEARYIKSLTINK